MVRASRDLYSTEVTVLAWGLRRLLIIIQGIVLLCHLDSEPSPSCDGCYGNPFVFQNL